MRLISEKLLGRVEALICTGSPGLYRVLAFWSIQHVYSLDELGRTGSSMSIAQMAGFFTSIGWATLILVRIPAASSRRHAIDEFYALAVMAAVTSIVFTAAIILASSFDWIRIDGRAVIALMWGWTAYQIARHYFVANKQYRIAIGFDCALIAGSCAVVWAGSRIGLSSPIALAWALGVVAVSMFVVIGAPSRHVRRFSFDIVGIQFGLTNFLSGGIPLAFIPFATHLCGTSFSGALSLLSSVTAVGILLPRAISMVQLPQIAKFKSTGDRIEGVLDDMRRHMALSNFSVCALNLALVVVLIQKYADQGIDRYGILMSGALLALYSFANIMGIVSSNVMMVFEMGATTARINILTSTSLLLLFAVGAILGNLPGFLFILSSSVAIALARNGLLNKQATAVCEKYAESIAVGSRGSKPFASHKVEAS